MYDDSPPPCPSTRERIVLQGLQWAQLGRRGPNGPIRPIVNVPQSAKWIQWAKWDQQAELSPDVFNPLKWDSMSLMGTSGPMASLDPIGGRADERADGRADKRADRQTGRPRVSPGFG
jgi:hypothetical protein